MKNILVILIVVNATAQNKHRDRIKTLKVGFITDKLDLTPEQAQKFWPIYNDFESKMNEIRFKELRAYRKEIRLNSSTMTEAEARKLITKMNRTENKMNALNNDLSNQLLDIIPAKKIILLKLAEIDFKKKMLQKLKKPKHN
jgi:Spy/CpxP family protein refolding chaperone